MLKKIDQDIVKKLLESKNEVLRRIAVSLEKQSGEATLSAAHSSHSSGTHKGHTACINPGQEYLLSVRCKKGKESDQMREVVRCGGKVVLIFDKKAIWFSEIHVNQT